MQTPTIASLQRAIFSPHPFPHWILSEVLPDFLVAELCTIELPRRTVPGDGTRSGSGTVCFANHRSVANNPQLRRVISIFTDRRLKQDLEKIVKTSLRHCSLRAALYFDQDEVWIQPHTDLDVKRVTLIVLLEHHAPDAPVATELYDGNGCITTRAPSRNNTALLFKPDLNTFHGVRKRKLLGRRITLVINYVTESWRNKHELVP